MPPELPPLVVGLLLAAPAVGLITVLAGASAAVIAARPQEGNDATTLRRAAGAIVLAGGAALLACGYLALVQIASEGNPPQETMNTAWHALAALAGIVLPAAFTASRLRSAPRLKGAYLIAVASIALLLALPLP